MSGAEGPEPAGRDPFDLQLPRGAAGSKQSSADNGASGTTNVNDTNDTVECHKKVCCK